MRAMMPHVDEFRPIDNLDSMKALCDALARSRPAPLAPRQRMRAAG